MAESLFKLTSGKKSSLVLTSSSNNHKQQKNRQYQPTFRHEDKRTSSNTSNTTPDYSKPYSEEGSRPENSVVVTQESDHAQTASSDYYDMFKIRIDVDRSHGNSDTHYNLTTKPTHSFSSQFAGDQYHHHSRSDPDLTHIIQTASQCYHALDFNLMIITLETVKLSPHISSKYTTAIYFGLGVAHIKITNYDMATSYLLKAQHVAISDKDLGTQSHINYNLAEIEYSQNKFLSSASYYEQAVTQHHTRSIGELYDIETPSLSVLYCRWGTALRYGSKVMEAVKMYKKAIELARSVHCEADELAAHTNLGNLYQAIGDYARAVEEYDNTIRLGNAVVDYISLGWAHGNIGNAYLGLSKRDKALYHLDQALSFTMAHEPTPQAVGRALNNLGTAYQAMNENSKAKMYYDDSLSQAIYGNDLPGQARVYGNLGNLLMVEEKYSDAIAHYTETLSISRDRATQTTAYHNRGCARYEKAESERKRHLESGECSSELLAKGKSQLTFVGANVKDYEEELKLPSLPESICKHYRSAQSDLEKVMKHHELTFKNIKGSQRGLSLSVSLFETNARTFQRLQDCSYCLGQWQQALVFAEQSRARTLGELLLGRKEKQLQMGFRTPLDLPQIVSIIQQQRLPVIYMTYTGVRLLTWIMVPTPSKHSSVSINMFQVALNPDEFDGKPFDYMVRYQLTEALSDRTLNMYVGCNYKQSTILNKLHKLIAEPLIRLLKSVLPPDDMSNLHDVVFIPDSYTKLIPMSALLDLDEQQPKFLGDWLRFHTMNSILTMGILYQLPSVVVTIPLDSNNVCIVGNPNIPFFRFKGEPWALGKLPFSEEEANRTAYTLCTKPILGNEATKDVVKSKLRHSKVIHLATHGCANAGFLVFAGSNAFSVDDDTFAKSLLLFPEDIEALSIPAALVVLSSCDSGRGTFKADGIQGTARSFLLAGAQTVLTSLWRVPDESASYFMHFFYLYLVDGLPSYTALQKACLSIRCYTKYGEYIHWSGYQLQGREIKFVNLKKGESDVEQNLGPVSKIPVLEELMKLEENLINVPNKPPSASTTLGFSSDVEKVAAMHIRTPLRTDVQLLVGSSATSPMQVIVDYIAYKSTHYTGGIFWIQGHSNDHTIACVQHINEIVRPKKSKAFSLDSYTDLIEYFSYIHDPVLLILHHFQAIPLSVSPLKALMEKPNVHIIITTHISVTSSSIASTAHKSLNRGCHVHSLLPIPFLQSMQRIIYFIVSHYELSPMNHEQEILEEIEELACGNSVVLTLFCAAIKKTCDDAREDLNCDDVHKGLNCDDVHESLNCDDVHKGLKMFYKTVVQRTNQRLEKEMVKSESKSEMWTAGTVSSKESVNEDTDNSVQVSEDSDQPVGIMDKESKFKTDKELQDTPNPAVLVFTQEILQSLLSSQLQHFFLSCISTLNAAPIHTNVLNSLEGRIKSLANSNELKLLAEAKEFNILVRYPSPVISGPSNFRRVPDCVDDYYVMPEVISEALYMSLNEKDKAVACSMLNYILNEILLISDDLPTSHDLPTSQDLPTLQDSTQQEETLNSDSHDYLSLHVIGLKQILLQCLTGEWSLFGSDVIESVIRQYITDKVSKSGDNEIMELIDSIITS